MKAGCQAIAQEVRGDQDRHGEEDAPKTAARSTKAKPAAKKTTAKRAPKQVAGDEPHAASG